MPVSAQGSLISKEGLTASLKDIWDTQKVPDCALTFATVNSETNTILRQCILKKNLDLDLVKNTHESYIFAVLVDFVLYCRMMVSYNPIFFRLLKRLTPCKRGNTQTADLPTCGGTNWSYCKPAPSIGLQEWYSKHICTVKFKGKVYLFGGLPEGVTSPPPPPTPLEKDYWIFLLKVNWVIVHPRGPSERVRIAFGATLLQSYCSQTPF